MSVLVAYTSKTGFTKTYAEWIAADLGAKLVTTDELTPELIREHDVVVHGGGNRAGNLGGLSKFLKFWDDLRGKQVVLWYTGASPENPEANARQWEKVLTPEQRDTAKLFYLRGGFDMAILRGKDKLMMSGMRSALKIKPNLSPSEQGMLKMFENPIRDLDREAVDPLVEYVRAL